jgi:predicted transcriptional regulator
MRGPPSRAYRSKLEVLRDFLRAAHEPVPKTRIIGTANLNPVSFRRYLQVCTERDLIMSVSGGYVATPRATPLLEAIDDLMAKREDLERALRVLEQSSLEGPGAGSGEGTGFRQVLREAWNDLALRPPTLSNGRRRPPVLAGFGASLPEPALRRGSSWSRGEPPVITIGTTGRRSSGSKRLKVDAKAPSSATKPRSRR